MNPARPSPTLARRVAIGAFALLLVVAAVVALRSTRRAPDVALSFALAPGHYVDRDVDITEHVELTPFVSGNTMIAETHVNARLRLEGVRPGVVRARFVTITQATALVDGKNALGDPASLVGPAAEVEMGADGLARTVRVPESDSPDFGRVVQLVLQETALPLGGAPARNTWTADERSPRGTFAATVKTERLVSGAVELARTRTVRSLNAPRLASVKPAELTGESSARMRLDGTLLALDVNELVRAYDAQGGISESRATHVRVVFAGEGTLAVDNADASGTLSVARDIADPVMSRDAQKRALENRTEGLTRETMNEIMEKAIVAGTAPDHAKFLWRASARLKLDDGAVDDLAAQFARTEATPNGRGLALDLLAAASSSHAQETLIALLQDPPAPNAKELSRWRQRLALVPAPDPATMAFLTEQSASKDAAWRDPARIALGAAARHRRELGDAAGAAAATDTLVEESNDLGTDRDVEVMVLALGNTYSADVVDEITSFATAERAQTRHVVAEALREIDHPAARATLIALGKDKEAAVARRAFESLETQKLGGEDLNAMTAATLGGQVHELALANLVTVASKHIATPEGRAVLEAVLSRKPDPRLQGRVRAILRSSPVP